MMRGFPIVLGAFLIIGLGGAPPAAGQGGKEQATLYATPQAAFDAFLAASKKEDMKALCHTLTDETVSQMTGALVFMGLFMKGFMELGAKEDKSGDTTKAIKALDDVFARHGLTKEKMDKVAPKQKDPTEKLDQKALEAAMQKLASLVKDRCAFLDDFVKTMKKLPGKQGEGFSMVPEGTVKLTDLKVQGDKASGTIATSKDGKDMRDPISFKKVGGGWKIDMDLFGKMVGRGAPPPPNSSRLEELRERHLLRPTAALTLARD